MKISKLAAIDIGSNSIRLLIINVIRHKKEVYLKKGSLIRLPVRLGSDSFIRGKISNKNRSRLIHAAKAFHHIMEVNDVLAYRACATSAMRDAENAPELIKYIQKESGIHIEVIDGEEEARLVLSNHFIDRLRQEKTDFLYIDVGGGSTEITVFREGEIDTSLSFNIGTVRLLNQKVGEDAWKEMKKWIEKETEGMRNPVLVGSGGNINRLLKLANQPAGSSLSMEYLEGQYTFLEKFSPEEMVTKLDLNVDRADVILHATRIFLNIMRWSGGQKIYVPKIGLSDGIVQDLYNRNFASEAEKKGK